MNRNQMIRIAHQNPHMRERVLRIIQATDRVASAMDRAEGLLMKEAAKGLPISKLLRYAQSGIFIVSAYRNQFSRKQNKERNEELRQMILSLGVPVSRIVKLKSQWLEENSDVPTQEQSFAILAPVSWADALRISNHFEQDGFIWSSPSNPLAMYEQTGKVTFAVDKDMATQISLSSAKDLYSRGRGGSFDIGFNWNNPLDWNRTSPIKPSDILAVAS